MRWLFGSHGLYLAGSSFLLAGTVVFTAYIWRRLSFGLGAGLPLRVMLEMHTAASLSGRIPGQVWPFVAAVSLGKKRSVGVVSIVSLLLYSQIFLLISGLFILSVLWGTGETDASLLPLPWGTSQTVVLLGLSPCLLLAIHPRLLQPFLSRLGRRRNPSADLSSMPIASVRLIFSQWFFYSIIWMLWVCAFFLFVQWITGPLELRMWRRIAVAFCASHLLGMLAIVFPQGLGVREGLLTLLLSRHLPVSIAALIAVATRVWSTLIVAALFLLARCFNGLKDTPPA